MTTTDENISTWKTQQRMSLMCIRSMFTREYVLSRHSKMKLVASNAGFALHENSTAAVPAMRGLNTLRDLLSARYSAVAVYHSSRTASGMDLLHFAFCATNQLWARQRAGPSTMQGWIMDASAALAPFRPDFTQKLKLAPGFVDDRAHSLHRTLTVLLFQ